MRGCEQRNYGPNADKKRKETMKSNHSIFLNWHAIERQLLRAVGVKTGRKEEKKAYQSTNDFSICFDMKWRGNRMVEWQH